MSIGDIYLAEWHWIKGVCESHKRGGLEFIQLIQVYYREPIITGMFLD